MARRQRGCGSDNSSGTASGMVSAAGSGSVSPSYGSVYSEALRSGQPFQDSTFPADESSLYLGRQGPPLVWKRPTELSAQPQLFAGDRVESDVCHDRPANAWFVTLCTVLANDPPLLAKVFPDHQQQEWREGTPHPGVFRFCFWLLGAWVEVLVDDRLPLTEKGLLYGCRSRTGSHFWAPLLEKAYAKFLGCYELLEACSLSDALVDMTGAVVEHLELAGHARSPNLQAPLFDKMLAALDRDKALVCCAISVELASEMGVATEQGLVRGHAYQVCGVRTVALGGSPWEGAFGEGTLLHLVRLRNPWRSAWTGTLGRGSAEWSRLSEQDRSKMNVAPPPDDDSEFWLTLGEFVERFTDACFCFVPGRGGLREVCFQGEWTVGERGTPHDRAGGCINYRSFLRNPQYRLDVKEDAEVLVLVYLMQDSMEGEGPPENCAIGIHVMQVEVNRQFRVHALKAKVCSSEYVRSRGVFLECRLQRGRFCLLPTTFRPGRGRRFLLRLLSRHPLDVRELSKDVPSAKLLPCQSMPTLATTLRIIGAKHLEQQDAFGLADPYCVVQCEGQSVRSAICRGTVDPVWNLSVIFYRKDSSTPIKIQVWNSHMLMDTYMAKAYVEAPLGTEYQILELPLVGSGTRPLPENLSRGALGTLLVEVSTTDDLLAV